jgi:hypothetical protein
VSVTDVQAEGLRGNSEIRLSRYDTHAIRLGAPTPLPGRQGAGALSPTHTGIQMSGWYNVHVHELDTAVDRMPFSHKKGFNVRPVIIL